MSVHLTRLLIAGVGPVPPEHPDRLHAPGLRVWGMARELAREGHPVRLLRAAFGAEPASVVRFDLPPSGELPDGLERDLPEGGLSALIAAEAREWGADAVVSTTDVMNHAVAAAGLDLPVWMDFFGDPMAERQMLALRSGDDAGIDDQWSLLAPALARADRISGCSTDQCAALLGELAAVGRLGRYTAGERIVHRLAPWFEPLPPAHEGAGSLLRDQLPGGAFLIVQTGGFNTWLDVETLFAALTKAMESDPRIHFAASGGAIDGHYTGGFEWFAEQVAASRHADRFHLLGWLPLSDVPRLLAEADLALNIDLPCAEGILGTRNRLLDWVGAGLPVITTPGCELALELEDEEIVQVTPHGDPDAAARAILDAVIRRRTMREAAGRAPARLASRRKASRCLRPLLEWAVDPKPASDLQAWRSGEAQPPELWRLAADVQAARAAGERQARRLAWLEDRLARMEGSRWVRLALRLRGRHDLPPSPE